FETLLESVWINSVSLLIDSDSVTALSWVQDRGNRPWRLWKFFNDIDGLIDRCLQVSFVHTIRRPILLLIFLPTRVLPQTNSLLLGCNLSRRFLLLGFFL
ncbi:hypothetical protein Golax_014779, partial [Gossypium laxum]|nr:hypothetical protein [Gossypium laxum]